MDWSTFFWILAIVNAVAAGATSIVAYVIARRAADDDSTRRRSHAIYMTSYVLMSASILFVALRGFAQ